MESEGNFYNLYHEVDRFKKEIKEYGFRIEEISGGNFGIEFPQIAGELGSIFSNHILVLYDNYWKNHEEKDKKLRKGAFSILEALVEDFEVK